MSKEVFFTKTKNENEANRGKDTEELVLQDFSDEDDDKVKVTSKLKLERLKRNDAIKTSETDDASLSKKREDATSEETKNASSEEKPDSSSEETKNNAPPIEARFGRNIMERLFGKSNTNTNKVAPSGGKRRSRKRNQKKSKKNNKKRNPRKSRRHRR